MSTAAAIATAATFLIEHADIIEDLIKAIESGISKDDIRAAIRGAKVTADDVAVRKDLGLDP